MALRRFIKDELGWANADALTDDYPLIEKSILDSIGVFHIVAFVEAEFGVDIADDEIDLRHFGSIRSIAETVRARA